MRKAIRMWLQHRLNPLNLECRLVKCCKWETARKWTKRWERARLIAILTALSKSKTIWGILGMLGSSLLGAIPWDVAVRVGSEVYTIPDLTPYLQPVFASLAVYGRITAKAITEAPHA